MHFARNLLKKRTNPMVPFNRMRAGTNYKHSGKKNLLKNVRACRKKTMQYFVINGIEYDQEHAFGITHYTH